MKLSDKIELIKKMLGDKFTVRKNDMFQELEIIFTYKGVNYKKILRYHDIYNTEINIVFIKCFKDSFLDFIINTELYDIRKEME